MNSSISSCSLDAKRQRLIEWILMITASRLNGKPFVINADLIRTVEENPDTTITLINGDRLIVKETMKEVVSKVIDYGRHLRRMTPPS